MVKIANIQLHSPFTCTLKILHPGCPALSISGALGQLPPPLGSLRHWLYPGTAGTVIFTTSQVGLFCGPNISKYYLRFILYFNRHRVNLCVKKLFLLKLIYQLLGIIIVAVYVKGRWFRVARITRDPFARCRCDSVWRRRRTTYGRG